MSSFLHDAKHFNSVERGIIRLFCRRPHTHFYLYSDLTKREPYRVFYPSRTKPPEEAVEAVTYKIVDTLRELSAVCITLQYRHHYAGRVDTEIAECAASVQRTSDYIDLDEIGLYVACQSLMYQIETQHLTELRPLTQDETDALTFTRELIDGLAHEIIRGLDAYENAKWTI